jgi:hypothetical protein
MKFTLRIPQKKLRKYQEKYNYTTEARAFHLKR